MPRSERHERVLEVAERVYEALLVVYPREFRNLYGSQMVQLFRDLGRRESRRKGTPGLVGFWIRTVLDLATTALVERRSTTGRSDGKETLVNDYKLAGAGLAFLAAPLFFVTASLLKYGLGVGLLFDPLDRAFMADPESLRVFNLVSPLVFLGGLVLALALNAYAVLRLSVGMEEGKLVTTVRLSVKLWNIAVALVSIVLLVTLVGYVFLENFTYRP